MILNWTYTYIISTQNREDLFMGVGTAPIVQFTCFCFLRRQTSDVLVLVFSKNLEYTESDSAHGLEIQSFHSKCAYWFQFPFFNPIPWIRIDTSYNSSSETGLSITVYILNTVNSFFINRNFAASLNWCTVRKWSPENDGKLWYTVWLTYFFWVTKMKNTLFCILSTMEINFINIFQLWVHSFNTLRPRQIDRHFSDDIFKCIFLNENVWIAIKISLKFVPKAKGPTNICISNGSDNGLATTKRQAIIWNNDG